MSEHDVEILRRADLILIDGKLYCSCVQRDFDEKLEKLFLTSSETL